MHNKKLLVRVLMETLVIVGMVFGLMLAGCDTGGGGAVTVVFAVANETEWNSALTSISNAGGGSSGNPEIFGIRITGNFSVAGKTSGYSITGAYKEVWLTGDKTISLSSGGSLIRTAVNQTFVIDGPVLQGSADNNAPIVYIFGSGSAVELRNGEIRDNINSSSSYGGGVYVFGGTFTMEGGTITGNTAYGNRNGGGVYVSGGTFTMKGGTITKNTAIGGGGVYVSGGTFTMEGGTITENTTIYSNGGGVFVNNEGTFMMEGGIISGNTAQLSGGGVFVVNGKFTKTGNSTIYGDTDTEHTPGSNENTAANGNGHAVYVASDSPKKRNADAGPEVEMYYNESGWE
jgi:hypothetical protein